MKNIYEAPVGEVIILSPTDVITTSTGTESPWGDLGFGAW